MINFFKKKSPQKKIERSFGFHNIGFHGDSHLLSVVDYIVDNYQIEYFIETGTNVGSTLAYFAKTYPDIKCLSCEPDKTTYEHALQNTAGLKNVMVYNLLSQNFIKEVKQLNSNIFNKTTLVWLDAHSYGFEWPLKEEVSFFTENFPSLFLMIDDFKIPDITEFSYDSYKDQLCAHEYIKDDIKNTTYELIYPNYTEKTSFHHPLVGWGLYSFGNEIVFPDNLADKVKKAF
ncbi:MAG: hypothetical protein K9L30_13410 [Desulfobacterales bacterium]|nr:hypothetical protein [Desulfobacterales bacterium]